MHFLQYANVCELLLLMMFGDKLKSDSESQSQLMSPVRSARSHTVHLRFKPVY